MKTLNLQTLLWAAGGTLLVGAAVAFYSAGVSAAERAVAQGEKRTPSESVLDKQKADDGLAFKLFLHRGAYLAPLVQERRA